MYEYICLHMYEYLLALPQYFDDMLAMLGFGYVFVTYRVEQRRAYTYRCSIDRARLACKAHADIARNL